MFLNHSGLPTNHVLDVFLPGKATAEFPFSGEAFLRGLHTRRVTVTILSAHFLLMPFFPSKKQRSTLKGQRHQEASSGQWGRAVPASPLSAFQSRPEIQTLTCTKLQIVSEHRPLGLHLSLNRSHIPYDDQQGFTPVSDCERQSLSLGSRAPVSGHRG